MFFNTTLRALIWLCLVSRLYFVPDDPTSMQIYYNLKLYAHGFYVLHNPA